MIPLIPKRKLGILAEIGAGKTGVVYSTSFGLAQSNSPLLYKEYKQQFLNTIDINVLREMVSYISSLRQAEAKQLLLNCSWPLALVENQQDKVIGILFECADECYRTSNYIKKREDFKGTSELFCPDKNYEERTGCQPLLYEEKELLILRLASILDDLHKRQIVVGDISPMNILVAVFPDYRVFLIDADSMSIRGRSILSDVRTPNWAVKDRHSQESESSYASDCYKLALFALRIFKQQQSIHCYEDLPQNVNPKLASLIDKTLLNDASTRPPISEWIKVLQGRATVGRVARSFLSHGQNQARQGNGTKAKAAFDKAIVLDNSLADAYLARSEVRISLGDLDGGIVDYNYIAQLQPHKKTSFRIRLSQSLYEYGQEESCRGNKANAIAAYGKAIETNPDSADALLARAELRMEQRDLTGAIDDYNALVRLKPNQKGLYNNRGVCKWENKDYRGAYDDFTLEITRNPNAASFYHRAAAKKYFGDTKGAISDISKGLALDPHKINSELKAYFEQNKHLTSNWSRLISPFYPAAEFCINNWTKNVKKTHFVIIVILVTSASIYSIITRLEDETGLARERSSLVEVQKLINTGDYVGCIQKVASIRAGLRKKLQIEADDLRMRCMNARSSSSETTVTVEKKASIEQCQQEGDWTVIARIENTEARSRTLSVVKQTSCSNSYIDGDTVIASRMNSENDAMTLANRLNNLMQSNQIKSDVGFVAQSRTFLAGLTLFSPFDCKLTKTSDESQEILTTRCNAFFNILGRHKTPLVEMVVNTKDGDGVNVDWRPTENGYKNNSKASVSCHEGGMDIEVDSGFLRRKISLPFIFLPCERVQLKGVCADQTHYDASHVYMAFGACMVTRRGPWRIVNGESSLDIVFNSSLKMRFSRSGSSSVDGGKVAFFQRLNDEFPRTEQFTWSQKEEGVVVNVDSTSAVGSNSWLIWGIRIE